MKLNLKKPSQALNAAFLKVKPIRADFDKFKANMRKMLAAVQVNESEEFHKNLISLFLRETYLGNKFYINTNDRTDLVIHTGESAKSNVAVLIETKRPSTTSEMPTRENINVKAFHELILYYMRERVTKKNLDIKNLIATNVFEWFVFDANMFQRLFADNKDFVKRFQDFEDGRLTDKVTSTFYNEIAKPYIETLDEITFTYFDLRTYQDILNIEINTKKLSENLQLDFGEAEALEQEKQLIELYKVLSAEHLLKLPFLNDSNTLDRQFYTELLHIIGLTEATESGKKLIKRKEKAERDSGSLLENTIARLETLDRLSNFDNLSELGSSKEERLFNIALDLCLTWLNRILFLKLLESQLLSYHRGNRDYSFLNYEKISDFGMLENLFFNVLAKRLHERNGDNSKYTNIPYLNSSLFEPTDTERKGLFISNLFDARKLKVLTPTVLKDRKGNQIKGEKNFLEYFFGFLSAYDFSSEGSLEIQEQNKTLINASVLGLIFEKINGYKDGSFFTPGFITMYMAREAIRPAVIQKFNEVKGWQCKDLIDLANKIEDIKEANQIFNTIRVCDPAVGSGHFLVSALNELITIKRELGILTDRKGLKIRDYYIKIENDELIITDTNNQLFEYNKNDVASRELQEALFIEKKILIENCLFGVDINPNSVKICRLRLWIELLKNAYYTSESNYTELETLPNIDINIKTGNSLISRFPIDADLSLALKKSKWDIESYKTAVQSYKNTDVREVKKELMKLIDNIKNNFSIEISSNNADVKKLERLEKEYYEAFEQAHLLVNELSETEAKRLEKKKEKMLAEIKKQGQIVDDLRTNKIYDNAFEWRFEFPELLDDNGDFLGFDVIIGNPPYISSKEIDPKQKAMFNKYETAKLQYDLYSLFTEKGVNLLKQYGKLSLIIPDSILARSSFRLIREYLYKNTNLEKIAQLDNVFDEAAVSSCLIFLSKHKSDTISEITYIKTKDILSWKSNNIRIKNINYLTHKILDSYSLLFINKEEFNLLLQIYQNTVLENFIKIWRGEEIGKKSDLISEEKTRKNYIRIITGENIERYRFKGRIKYIKKSDINKSLINYSKNKIVIRQVGTIINAQFDKLSSISTQSVYNIYSIDKLLSNYFLLGLLNSRLMNFVYRNLFAEKQQFPRILIENIKNLPLPKNHDEGFTKIEQLVNQILDQKQYDPTADTSDLEQQIDLLVYKLYELTYNEVKIIDPEFALSQEEYENLEIK